MKARQQTYTEVYHFPQQNRLHCGSTLAKGVHVLPVARLRLHAVPLQYWFRQFSTTTVLTYRSAISALNRQTRPLGVLRQSNRWTINSLQYVSLFLNDPVPVNLALLGRKAGLQSPGVCCCWLFQIDFQRHPIQCIVEKSRVAEVGHSTGRTSSRCSQVLDGQVLL